MIMLVPTLKITGWAVLERIAPGGRLLVQIFHEFHGDSFLKDGQELVLSGFEVIVVFIHWFWDISHVYLHGHHIGVVLDFDVLVVLLLKCLEGVRGRQCFLRLYCCLRSYLSWWSLLILIRFDWSYAASLTWQNLLSWRLLGHGSDVGASAAANGNNWVHEIQIKFGIMLLLLLFLFVGRSHRSWERIGKGGGRQESIFKRRYLLLKNKCVLVVVHCFFCKGLGRIPRAWT